MIKVGEKEPGKKGDCKGNIKCEERKLLLRRGEQDGGEGHAERERRDFELNLTSCLAHIMIHRLADSI